MLLKRRTVNVLVHFRGGNGCEAHTLSGLRHSLQKGPAGMGAAQGHGALTKSASIGGRVEAVLG